MAIGLFGKYPAKRDFVAVNLPRSILQPLENWLQGGLSASRERLGRAWNDHYMVQPIWNFRLGPDVIGVDCMGALMPSVDGVGRTFPLLIAAYAEAGEAGYGPFEGLDPARWFPDAQARLLAALEDEAPPEPAALIEGLADPEPGPAEIETLQAMDGGRRALIVDNDVGEALKRMTELHRRMADRGRSIWWTEGGAKVPAQMVSFVGMPDVWFMANMMATAPVQPRASA